MSQLISIQPQTTLNNRMIFVMCRDIYKTMVRVALIVTSILIAALTIYIQPSLSTTRTLDITINDYGISNVKIEVDVDSLSPDYKHQLFGNSIDNFFAFDKDNMLLSNRIIDDQAIINTLGTSTIYIQYNTHDLISKNGRIWTFTLDSPIEYTLLLPANSVIQHVNSFPSSTRSLDDRIHFGFNPGMTEIEYIINSTVPINSITKESNDESYMINVLVVSAAVSVSTIIIYLFLKRRQPLKSEALDTISESTTPTKSTISTDTSSESPQPSKLDLILADPDIRDDDKEIIKFISENGGQVLERDLRKKFLQPKTTMWRAVKRLERHDIVEITKKDMHNLVKFKEDIQ